MIRFPSTLPLLLIACAQFSFAQLTLQQHKDNNTAACGGTAAPPYCTAGTFPPKTDNQAVVSGNTILTPTFNFGYTTGAAQGNRR